jgi:hypothetical protein
MAVGLESTLPMNALGKLPAVNIPKAPPVPASKHTEFDPDRSIESYGLLDLYSHDAFLTVLHTPRIYDAFANFLQSEHSSENLAFWSRAERFRQVNREMVELVSSVDKIHLQPGAPEEINVSHRSRTEAIQNVNTMTLSLEESSKAFNDLQREVEMLMWRDSYPRFLKHHLAYNASRSLEWYPGKSYSFKGLGECFCLTDPQ